MLISISIPIFIIIFNNVILCVSSGFDYLYHITLENQGLREVQLISRKWHFESGNSGDDTLVFPDFLPGVVGESPVIQPGEAFQYYSSVSLKHSNGFMKGAFRMEAKNSSNEEEKEVFEVEIPKCNLLPIKI